MLYKPVNYDSSKVAYLDEYRAKKGKIIHFPGIVSALSDKSHAMKYLQSNQAKPVILQMEFGPNNQGNLFSLDSKNYTNYSGD